ncbi:hypothetical protein THAOC_07604, partial [Thalassiosira oceanica]
MSPQRRMAFMAMMLAASFPDPESVTQRRPHGQSTEQSKGPVRILKSALTCAVAGSAAGEKALWRRSPLGPLGRVGRLLRGRHRIVHPLSQHSMSDEAAAQAAVESADLAAPTLQV